MLTPIDTGKPSQLDALRNFADAADLAALEKLVGDAAATQLPGLHDFADSCELAVLERMMGEAKSKPAEPDLLAIIGVQGDETVHSNFLA